MLKIFERILSIYNSGFQRRRISAVASGLALEDIRWKALQKQLLTSPKVCWNRTRSVASGLALGNMCWKVRGLSTGRLSSIVAAKGDCIAVMSSADGRPTAHGTNTSTALQQR